MHPFSAHNDLRLTTTHTSNSDPLATDPRVSSTVEIIYNRYHPRS